MRVKLVIDKRRNTVLFTEADSILVDFLLHMLTLPVGTVVRILISHNITGSAAVGCLGTLYQGFEKLDNTYIDAFTSRDAFLRPKFYTKNCDPQILQLFPELAASSTSAPTTYYRCLTDGCSGYVSESAFRICTACGTSMTMPVKVIADTYTGFGYVKRPLVYMVMDNLGVKPLSIGSVMALFNEFNGHGNGAVEERVVDIRTDEAVKLLKASLTSKTALTDVFLEAKKRKQETD